MALFVRKSQRPMNHECRCSVQRSLRAAFSSSDPRHMNPYVDLADDIGVNFGFRISPLIFTTNPMNL